MGSVKDNVSKRSSATAKASKIYRKPFPCSPLTCSKSGSGYIRLNLMNLNEEQRKSLACVKRLEEKLEKKRQSRATTSSKMDMELKQAIDGLMTSVGTHDLLH